MNCQVVRSCSLFIKNKLAGARLMIVLAMLAGCSGCEQEPDITQYVIDKRVPEQLNAQQRMLGAMVPAGEEVLFFKLVGDSDSVDRIALDVRKWITGVKVVAGEPELVAPPEWTLRMGGSNSFDVAKLDLPVGEPPLELKITRLARNAPWSELVRSNVNRWRGQMGLEESADTLGGAIPLVDGSEAADESPAMWVDLRGSFGSGSMGSGMMGQPPFAQSMGSGVAAGGAPSSPPVGGSLSAAPNRAATSGESSSVDASPLEYSAPEGWQPGKMGPMRMAAFAIGEGNASAEITVIIASGDLVGNVQRWLGQVHPGGVPDGELERVLESGQEVTVDGRVGKRFFMRGSGEQALGIDGTMVPREDGSSLFIKMTGDADVVTAEADRIGQFLGSLKVKL
jgi:hypothetical protein